MAHRLKREGSILILAVWTLFFLAALAVAVGSYVSGGLMIARQSASASHGRAALMAGIERAVAVLSADTNAWDSFDESWGYRSDVEWENAALGDGVYSVYHITGGGVTNAGVVDEDSRININKADKSQLESLFRVVGKVDSVQAAALAAAVIDWRDPDQDVSEGGAESGFYAGMAPGYKCADDDFDTVFEMLLLRGMTQDIYNRIEGFITVYGAGKVNINTSEPVVIEVLAQAAGADESVARGLAEKIEAFRLAGGSFTDANAMTMAGAVKGAGLLGAEEESILLRMMMSITLRGSCFRGISEGRRSGSAGGVVMEFVYSREKQRILYWNEI
jgi:type II secretory pathway component PulK